MDGDNHRTRLAEAEWDRFTLIVGRRYAHCRLSNYIADSIAKQSVISEVRAYMGRMETNLASGNGLVLIGTKGTGKDHLAVATMREACRRGASLQAVDGQVLFQQMRDLIGTDRKEESLIREYSNPDILLISDPVPLSGNLSDHQINGLWRIFDRRSRDMRPTIVTMNVADRMEAESKLGSPLVDRMCDGATVLQCVWESYRKTFA